MLCIILYKYIYTYTPHILDSLEKPSISRKGILCFQCMYSLIHNVWERRFFVQQNQVMNKTTMFKKNVKKENKRKQL